jgi:putative tricarboxylic transport membrane protein
MSDETQPQPERTPPLLRQDTAAGIVVIAVAAFALWQGADLVAGSLGAIGAGLLPRALAALFGLLGLVLLIGSLLQDGERLARWRLREPALVIAAVVTFGLCVRPLGLIVAGPLTVIIGAAASAETRWSETLVFALVMTLFSVLLFKFALGLPIPLAPWLIGY